MGERGRPLRDGETFSYDGRESAAARTPERGTADPGLAPRGVPARRPGTRTLTELLHRDESDNEVRAAREQIYRVGWVADILATQGPTGAWPPEKNFYSPKYLATNWQLLVLADLGATRSDPRIAGIAEQWMERFSRPDGGFGTGGARGHLCITGNCVRALIQFGYGEDPRVQAGIEWMLRNQAKLGGWSCFGSGRNLDSWEPLSAFAVYPRAKWTPPIEQAVQRGAEFFLSRELHVQGAPYSPGSGSAPIAILILDSGFCAS